MKKLELYFFPECPYCQIVLKAIKETKMESSITFKDIHKNPAYKEFLSKTTGKSSVPVLFIDGSPLRESKDIAAWIHKNS